LVTLDLVSLFAFVATNFTFYKNLKLFGQNCFNQDFLKFQTSKIFENRKFFKIENFSKLKIFEI